jgi:phage recombination protein Bet
MSDEKQTGLATANNATKTLELVRDGKVKELVSLVPEGLSPKLFIDLVKTQIMGVDAKGKPREDADLLLFLYVCKRTGLDPLTKQIYAVFRWDNRLGKEKMTIQAGIDGMRLVAQRTGKYAGQEDVSYLPVDEQTKYPVKATVTVYKNLEGQRVGFTATARWNEYVQLNPTSKTPNSMWDRMPYNQLGKCAEALALRKGFPNELSGIYAPEEMAQADNVLTALPTPKRFDKPEEMPIAPVVDHGAPADQVAPVVGSPEAATVKEGPPKTPADIAQPVATEKVDDIAKKREELKARVEDSRKLANEPVKTEEVKA